MNTSSAGGALRVVHLPARTPYVRKLRAAGFRTVNGTDAAGAVVPVDVSAAWLLDHRPFTWFDVLHLHHIEFEDPADLERLLDACGAARTRVVCTAHDLRAMFGDDSGLHKRLRVVDAAGAAWICLTRGSRTELGGILGREVEAAVIPHGYVVDPDSLGAGPPPRANPAPRFLLYGSMRANRDQLAALLNWSLSTTDPDSRLELLVRGLSPVELRASDGVVLRLLDAARADRRVITTMRPYPTDREVVEAALAADALLLPYLWATHSGQLELAFDLGMLAVASSVGHLPEQAERHRGLVAEPEWFDWTNGNPYTFGERFVAALDRAHQRVAAGSAAARSDEPRPLNRDFIDYRRTEHQQILAAHQRVYSD
ncbi:hypothetical protein ACFPZ0_14010 [Streptomonospora nanhaiensis]|uniref:Glycosyltransferase subfamily 4-like N-terminal domain-containing protein n=1 Tax=Streptomonospora nanhaiensis TaxID=1323731 RepID=A0A853BLQ9_9ACTN|nr:hypothetical protein [Streptomonospora nanhaiensis]MBV2365330.1 hypothetical protein [Streptomonospora nanhaiensis]MBX9389445.1 hypothetical protein [Streptomonospora nanhaiensis]NYI95930.1 hypothetical protein [Streptomonospora nanhaiensis]